MAIFIEVEEIAEDRKLKTLINTSTITTVDVSTSGKTIIRRGAMGCIVTTETYDEIKKKLQV